MERHGEPVLTGREQAAGHRQDTACKAAQHWSRSCGSAWISRYVLATEPPPSICSHHTARQGPEEEHYQLPPVENVPQDHRPSQAKLSNVSVAAHATLYTICIPTARRDGRCASAHAGGVLSAITTLGRRSGEVGTVYICNLREGDKSTNHHLSITCSSHLCAIKKLDDQQQPFLLPLYGSQNEC